MVRPTGVKRGFTKLAVSMLQGDPSRIWTAEELAAEALRRDPTFSVAKNPVISLRATFEKEVRDSNLPEVEVVGSYPKRYRWRRDSAEGVSSSSEPPSQSGNAREYIMVSVGEAQFRGPATVENLNTGIDILQRIKEKFTA